MSLSLPLALVLASGMIHATWNLFAKKSTDKVVFLWCTQAVAMLFFLPFVWGDLHQVTAWSWQGAGWVGLSMLLHGLYVLLLAKAYSAGDLSYVYPLMRGTSPLLVPLAAILFLGESLPWSGWLGVAAIVAGIFLLNGGVRIGSGASGQAALLAVGVGLSISAYTVVDKVALTYASPLLVNWASNIGNWLMLLPLVLRSRTGTVRQEWTAHWKTILLGGILAPGGYLLFLYGLQLAPVAVLAPMREIGTVFGTLLAVLLLQEPQGKRRIGASAVITAGIICLGVSDFFR